MKKLSDFVRCYENVIDKDLCEKIVNQKDLSSKIIDTGINNFLTFEYPLNKCLISSLC